MNASKYFILFLFVFGCVEPYEFIVHDKEPTLVVEGFISDKSFIETQSYPSDGRYFTIKLSYSGDVTNQHALPVSGATVLLVNDEGKNWKYDEAPSEPGIFRLADNIFKALPDRKYKLRIIISDEIYESAWETLPSQEVPLIGEIGFAESEEQVYIMEANEPVLRTRKVIVTHINVPENVRRVPIYYRWQFIPLWIYKAPLSSVVDPGNTCWATEMNYLNKYGLQIDNSGGYEKKLFTIPTVRNERIYEDFSVLVVQHAMSEKNYYFWKEMMDQNENSALIDAPPFTLQSNIHSTTGEKKVSGFFGVVKEQAKRWYFNKSQLSYHVINTLRGDCLVVYGPGGPAPECTDCRQYSNGDATTVKPMWWRQ